MRRKITTLLMAFGAILFANAQEYNLFDPADVDANGWIWFDTQEKIDKYIGQANNEDGKIDPDGKIIQLICADFGQIKKLEEKKQRRVLLLRRAPVRV